VGARGMSVGPAYRAVMDTAPVVSMGALWPELAGQRRTWEVVVTVPREDGGEPLVPRTLPPEVLGCWSAEKVVASVMVLAWRPSSAVAAVEALVSGLTRSAGAVVTVRAAGLAGAAIVELSRHGADAVLLPGLRAQLLRQRLGHLRPGR
jgi:hypothetical protein